MITQNHKRTFTCMCNLLLKVIVTAVLQHISCCHHHPRCNAWSIVPSSMTRNKNSIINRQSLIFFQHNQNNEDDVIMEDNNNNDDGNIEENVTKPYYRYKQPIFSKSFLNHLNQVKKQRGYDNINNEGVDCTGEPSIDPSRMVQDDGLDSEYLNDYNNIPNNNNNNL